MICIVYRSRHGKNQHCAGLLTENFRAEGHETNLYSVSEVRARSLPDAVLYVFCSRRGITGPPRTVVRFARHLARTRVSPLFAIVHVRRSGSAPILRRLTRILDIMGFKNLGPALDLEAEVSGTIEAGYEKRLAAFADDCIRSLP